MAAIGKIRSWGPVLATVIGLALFAFIAEEMFRSCEATGNERRQQVGEVLGKKISVQEFQALVDEYQDVMKMSQNRDNLSEEELNQVKDQVWQEFVNTTILKDECDKLGLTVTDEELQNVLKAGTNQMLMQTPFVNQETGKFDVTQLTKFLSDYKKMQQTPGAGEVAEQYQRVYNYWKFVEKQLRQQLLTQKYQSLLASCLLSNPVSTKMAFDAQNTESSILLAALPYSTIKDTDVQVADADLKAKIDGVEKELKDKKAAEVKAYFDEYLECKNIDFVTFEQANINITLSASLKSLKEQAKAFIDRIDDDLALIDTQEHKAEILVEYKKTLNASAAVTGVNARFKAIEDEKKRIEEAEIRKAAEEQHIAEIRAAVPEPIMEAVPEPIPEVEAPAEEQLYTLKFTVTATKDKLRELKAFLDNGGYTYG